MDLLKTWKAEIWNADTFYWTSFSPVEEVVPVGEDAVAGRPEAQQRAEQNHRVERQVEVTGWAAARHRGQEVG